MDTTATGLDAAFCLPPAHTAIQDAAAAVAARFADRHREVRLHPFEHCEPHPALWAEFCAQGWPALMVAPEHGGNGGGLLAFALVLEELAAAGVVLWMPVLTAAIGQGIAEAGPDGARERWLEPIAGGTTAIALAVTEPDCGHNVFRSRTTIRREGDRFVVDGTKGVTSGIDLAERVLVFGRVPRDGSDGPAQFTTVMVDPDAAGIERVELPMRGREGVRQFQLTFTGVEVPLEALVGTEGQGLLVLWPITHVERLLTAALAVGGARFCLDRTLERAKDRSVFGQRPIGAEQAIQHPIAHLHARLEAVRLLVHRAAARVDAGTDPIAVAGDANVAKLLSAELLYDAADHAVHTFGAAAWDEREGLLDMYLDARLARSAPVSQELALNFIAQHVLGLPTHR
jgi:alkylation response protein AidB-like acyl-CoA dehydrogenase